MIYGCGVKTPDHGRLTSLKKRNRWVCSVLQGPDRHLCRTSRATPSATSCDPMLLRSCLSLLLSSQTPSPWHIRLLANICSEILDPHREGVLVFFGWPFVLQESLIIQAGCDGRGIQYETQEPIRSNIQQHTHSITQQHSHSWIHPFPTSKPRRSQE